MKYNLQDINSEWDRYYKGYYYEMLVQENLASHNIDFNGNPSNFEEWKKTTNTNYDINVKVNDTVWLTVECKLTLTQVYDSWFYRDWYSRQCDIIVTNDKFHISLNARNILYSKGVVLLETYDLVPFINNLKEGNKSSMLYNKGIDNK